MIATSKYKYITNSNKQFTQTRSAIKKANRRKRIKQCISFTFGILSIAMAAGAPIHIDVEISNYPDFTMQLALSAASLWVAVWVWRK